MSSSRPFGSPQWQILTEGFGAGGTGGGIAEAPVDGQLYSRQGSTASWIVSPSGGGGSVAWDSITDKPSTFPPDLEAVDDRVGSLLVAGANITLNYNDAANSLTIASTASGGGGGTTILNDDGPPLLATGATGDYYVDNTGNALYGPKAGAFLPLETILAGGTPVENPGTYRLGNKYTFNIAGIITKARFYRPSGSSTSSHALTLYNPAGAGAVVATTNPTTGETGAGWFEAAFPTPVSVAAGSSYVIAYDASAYYIADNTIPPVVADPAHAVFVQGQYGGHSEGMPGATTTSSYMIDLVWTPVASGETWPVAVAGGGGTPGGATTQVQFNDAGAFAGDTAFTVNKTTGQLQIGIKGGYGEGGLRLNNVNTGHNIVLQTAPGPSLYMTTPAGAPVGLALEDWVNPNDGTKFHAGAEGWKINWGTLITASSVSLKAGFRLPHGVAPTTPVDGDMWTMTTGLFARINGATVGPYITGSGVPSPSDLVPVMDGTAIAGVSALYARGDHVHPTDTSRLAATHAGTGGTAHANVVAAGAAGFMTGADKTKLDGLANYSHPTGDGNLHVPATGTVSNGMVLKAGATAGSGAWAALAQSDIGGLVTALAGKEPTIAAGTTAQYWRGDKSWVAFPTTMTPAAHVHPQSEVTNLVADLALKAPLASPNFSGVPLADTATAGTSTRQIASTAYVMAAVAAAGGASPGTAPPLMDGTATVGTSSLYSRQDHIHPSDTSRQPLITIGTTAQYYRGDKSWQTLDKASVGLGNVDNTSDASKPVSTAGAAADALRVLKAGDTMSGALTVNASVSSSRDFISTGATAYLATTGAGAISLRPNGVGSATGELSLTSAGVVGATQYNAANGIFQSTAGGAILAAATGDVYLRPNGGGSGTGQAYLTTGGVFTLISLMATGADGLHTAVSAGLPARVRTTVAGARVWSAGCLADGRWAVSDETAARASFYVQTDANFVLAIGNAFKSGGGVWADSSDARIKNVEGDYSRGLDEICALRPITYTFKGNDTPGAPTTYSTPPPPDAAVSKDEPSVPYPNSPHYQAAVDQKQFVGLIAQEVEAIFPEMVNPREGYIDGEQVSDLRDLDTSPLLFALVNSVKSLHARLTALEGPPPTKRKK